MQVLKERGVDEAIIVGVADKRLVDRFVVFLFKEDDALLSFAVSS